MRRQLTTFTAALLLAVPSMLSAQTAATPAASQASAAQPGVLSQASTEKLLPPSIFFKGQIATVQARNAGAVRFPDNTVMVATMVDSSGYSSAVRERFQLYILTESPVSVGGKTLAPGAYGAGFLENGTFVILDLGAHEIGSAKTTADTNLKRPRPLQLVAGPSAGQYRLYSGRSFVTVQQGH